MKYIKNNLIKVLLYVIIISSIPLYIFDKINLINGISASFAILLIISHQVLNPPRK